MQRLATAVAICALQIVPFASAQDATRKAHAADVLAGTWLPDAARYEEYWNPKDTNGLQRLPQPTTPIPALRIGVRQERITVDTIVDGRVMSSHLYTTDEKPAEAPLDDGVLQHIDSHWTSGGLVTHWGTTRDGKLLVRGSELWAPSADGNELTVTSVKEGLGEKRKTIAVYRRQAAE
jgi:hypothetical protein